MQTAEERIAKIHVTVIWFKEKIYESMTESVRRQWRIALVKEREKTFVLIFFTSYMSHTD